MKNDLLEFLRSRRSIRSFKKDPVQIDMIERILETAICAPSAHNLQPWRFVVLTDARDKSNLAVAVSNKMRLDMLSDGVPEVDIQSRVVQTIQRASLAPVIIVLCRDRKMVKPQPDAVREQAEAFMGAQSVALAGLQLLLAAHAEGLGGTWICWPLFAPAESIQSLGLSPDWEPQGMIFLGYPDETPEMPARISLSEVARFL